MKPYIYTIFFIKLFSYYFIDLGYILNLPNLESEKFINLSNINL